MGNAPVEPISGEVISVLDDPIKNGERKKPTHLNLNQNSGYNANGSFNHANGSSHNSNNCVVDSRKGSYATTGTNNGYVDTEDDDSDDLNLVQVIQQLIPFYGQGNSSNDSNLRAALSGLSIEDIDSKDIYGNTLLILACCYRCEDLVRIMLNKGADPSGVNTSGTCCLHFACHKDSASLAIAKALLNNGANPDIHELQYGCTPLHYCGSHGNIEFCKLLLSKGAQINAVDYYNFTCVDYARDAGFLETAEFLQQKLNQANSQQMISPNNANAAGSRNNTTTNNRGGGGGANGGYFFHDSQQQQQQRRDWNMYYDPVSGCNYYVHSTTGEAVWETEFALRMENMRLTGGQQHQSSVSQGVDATRRGSSSETSNNDNSNNQSSTSSTAPALSNKKDKEDSIKQCLISFLEKYDKDAILDADNLLLKHKGSEHVLLKELCLKYHANENEELALFKTKMRDFAAKNSNSNVSLGSRNPSLLSPSPKIGGSGGIAGGGNGNGGLNNSVSFAFPSQPSTSRDRSSTVDHLSIQNALAEERIKFETLLVKEREKYDNQITTERNKYTALISEKDASISTLQSKNDSLLREKQILEDDITNTKSTLSRAQMQGGAAVVEREAEIQRLTESVDKLRELLTEATQENQFKVQKISSLEDTLAGLASGNEERIARDQAAAAERERAQRESDIKHLSEIKEMEDLRRSSETKAKWDLAKVHSDLKAMEAEMQEKYDELKKTKDMEIERLQSQFAEEKSNIARMLSAITLELEHSKKETEEALQRMNASEEAQRSLREEIVEARTVQQLNAQLHKDLNREQLARKRLHNEIEDMKGKIRVYIRIRPLSKTELEKGCIEAVSKDGKLSATVRGIGGKMDEKKTFDFDQVFGGSEANTQTDVFRDTKHLIMSVLDGYNVCIFAYGQTGAGKSYTMIGASDIGSCLLENGDFDASSGITPRAVSELFRLLNERTAQMTYVVEVQMFQLYRDSLDDLLTEKNAKNTKKEDVVPLKIVLAEFSDTGLVQVQGANMITAETPQDVMKIFAKGSSRRTTASTQMNMESSRSHLVCSLVVKMTNRRSGVVSLGKLTLVDLAGSERVDKSGAEGEVLKEAQSINKSLSALGDVIAALTSNQNHIPYRNHPLTMLMSDTLGGNAKTLIFINTSPADYNVSETISSLNFGTRCKDITNSVASGPGVQLAQVNALKKELNKLKKTGGGGGAAGPIGPPKTGGGQLPGGLIRPV